MRRILTATNVATMIARSSGLTNCLCPSCRVTVLSNPTAAAATPVRNILTCGLCDSCCQTAPRPMMIITPGRTSPATATRAPGMPRRLSPMITLMLIALSPGRVWLISSASRKASSSSHLVSLPVYSRRYATTPPPKLIAPAVRKVQKIVPSGTSAAGSASAAAIASFMVIDRLVPHPVNHRGLGGAERDPVPTLFLDFLEKLLRQLARFAMQRGQALEFQLVTQLGDHIASARTVAPNRHRGLALHFAA